MFEERKMRSEKVPDLRGHVTRFGGEMGSKTKKFGNEIFGLFVSQLPLLAYPEILGTPASKRNIAKTCG